MTIGYLKPVAGAAEEVVKTNIQYTGHGTLPGNVIGNNGPFNPFRNAGMKLVANVIDANHVDTMVEGELELTATQWQAVNRSGLSLGVGLYYFASKSEPGKITSDVEDSCGLIGVTVTATRLRVTVQPENMLLNNNIFRRTAAVDHTLKLGDPVNIRAELADSRDLYGFVAGIVDRVIYIQTNGMLRLTAAQWAAQRWPDQSWFINQNYYLVNSDHATAANRFSTGAFRGYGSPAVYAISNTTVYIYPRPIMAQGLQLIDTNVDFQDKVAIMTKTDDSVGPYYYAI